MKLPKILIGLTLWGMIFYPLSLFAQKIPSELVQNLPFEQLKLISKPYMGAGYVKIAIEFELYGEHHQVDLFKQCHYFEHTSGEGDKFIFGLWLDGRNAVNYTSKSGWGIRIKFGGSPSELMGAQCVVKGENPRVMDWNEGQKRSSSRHVGWGDERGRYSSYADVTYEDDVTIPARIETYHRYHHQVLSGLPENVIVNDFKVDKITISYVENDTVSHSLPQSKSAERSEPVLLDKSSVTYRILALTKEDWGNNVKLTKVLGGISSPTVIDPAVYPELDCMYQVNERRQTFPKKGAACGLGDDYFFYGLQPALDSDGVWDLRKLSSSYVSFKGPFPRKTDVNNQKNTVIDSNYTKFKAGDHVFDLKEYREILTNSDWKRTNRLWIYDPYSQLLFSFRKSWLLK